MCAMASQITSLTVVYSTVYSGADQIYIKSPASLAFVRGIHRWPVNSPHRWPVMRKMFQFDDVIINRSGFLNTKYTLYHMLWTRCLVHIVSTLWRHDRETLSASLVICQENAATAGGFLLKRPTIKCGALMFLLVYRLLIKQCGCQP